MFTCMDHYFQMEAFTRADDPMLEGYTTLGYVAGLTEKMRLGLLVTGVSYRHPGLLAKIATTLDVLFGGRAMLGIGAAWYERENVGFGVLFYPIAERLERLEETVQICGGCGATMTAPTSARTRRRRSRLFPTASLGCGRAARQRRR